MAWRAAGVTSLAVGAFAFIRPDINCTALLYLLAAWVVVMGAFRLTADDHFRTMGIVAGCTVFIAPDRGLLSVMINLAIFAALNGLALIASGARPRALRPRPSGTGDIAA